MMYVDRKLKKMLKYSVCVSQLLSINIRKLYLNFLISDIDRDNMLFQLEQIKESSQYTRSDEKWRPFLPYVGKVIFKLLGSNYRILYQEEIFCQGMRNITLCLNHTFPIR